MFDRWYRYISLDELILELRGEIGDKVVCRPSYRIGSTQYGTEMYHEEEEVLAVGSDLHGEAANLVIEVHHWRLILSRVRVLGVCVLVCVVVVDGALVVPGGDDVYVVMRGHSVG